MSNISDPLDSGASSPAPDPAAAREEMLKAYPEKTKKKRAKQFVLNDPENPPQVAANTRTIPGIITQRGCTYAGCRGVVIGPMHDVLHITHGPVGCSFYSWQTRRNLARPQPGQINYLQYSMTTDMMEDEIIFGGEKKLAAAIREAYAIFKPKAIAVYATCPVGLIGDDIHTVCRLAQAQKERHAALITAMTEHLPECRITPVRGGGSCWVQLPDHVSALALARSAARHGVLIEPGDIFFKSPVAPGNFIRHGYQSIPAQKIPQGIQALAQAMREV